MPKCCHYTKDTIGTTARNQTWFSAFAGLCDIHFTTVISRDERLAYKARYGIVRKLVRVERFELPIFCSQSRRIKPDFPTLGLGRDTRT